MHTYVRVVCACSVYIYINKNAIITTKKTTTNGGPRANYVPDIAKHTGSRTLLRKAIVHKQQTKNQAHYKMCG